MYKTLKYIEKKDYQYTCIDGDSIYYKKIKCRTSRHNDKVKRLNRNNIKFLINTKNIKRNFKNQMNYIKLIEA